MTSALFRPLAPGEHMQRASAEVAAKLIRPNDRLTAFERLEIYNQQYWWRLLGCFNDDFRGLLAIVGQRKFDRIAHAYLAEHGSQSWSLRNLGQFLPDFLASHPELTSPHSALAVETARMEWAKIVAFDTAELPVIDPQKIARRDPARLRLKLQPYVTLRELRFPVDQLLKKVRERNLETGSASNAVSAQRPHSSRLLRVPKNKSPIFIAVHRVDFSVYYKRLEPEAFALLSAIRAGHLLADACEQAFTGSPRSQEEAAARIGEWFNLWTRLGWLAR